MCRSAGVAAGARDAEVELECVGLPGGQIDGAVAVEIAHDGEAAQLRGDDGVASVDFEIVVGVEPEVRAVEQADFVAVGGIAIEFAGESDTAASEGDGLTVLIQQREAGGLRNIEIGQAIAVGIDQPAEAGAGNGIGAINSELGKVAGWGQGGARTGEFTNEDRVVDTKLRDADQVRIDLHGEGEVAVRKVGILRVVNVVAVGVDVDAGGGEVAEFGAAIDGEAGGEVAAGNAVAAGEVRIVERLGGVAFAVELVAGGDRQRRYR